MEAKSDMLERLRAMFEEAPAALAVMRGPDLTIELANPLVLSLWHRTEEVIGRPLLEAVPELRGQGFDDLMREVMRTGHPYRAEETLVRVRRNAHSLEDVYVNFVYVPLRDGTGTVDGVFAFAFPVTDLVKARRAAQDARRDAEIARADAERANRMKDEFLATMSHELRTPLNAILGWASLLRSGIEDEAARDRALATIERNARAQARLIDDILDVSRIISGKLRLEVERVDVAAVVNAAVDVLRPAAAAKEIQLELHIGSDVGNINGDADRLQQVVWNLLSNAVRFTPHGGTVRVAAERAASSLRIIVSDTGIGILPEDVASVFERFRQVDSSTTRKHGGLGLGLAIVRHLVELHGGTVSVASAGKDQGATFTVCLPIAAVLLPGPEETQAARPSTRPGAAAASLRGTRVLAVDDDEDSRVILASALEHAGADVTTAASAREAFDLLERSPPDVLVSDIAMPDEDGYSLIRRVRTLPSTQGGDVPAIALTAYARREDERRALSAGYHRHLAKPVDPGTLTEAVASLSRRA